MYLEALVKVPDVKGKITFRTKGEATYVEYECNRVYFPDRKYTTVSRKTIGKLAIKLYPLLKLCKLEK